MRYLRLHLLARMLMVVMIAAGMTVFVSAHGLSLIHISEPTRQPATSRMPSSA